MPRALLLPLLVTCLLPSLAACNVGDRGNTSTAASQGACAPCIGGGPVAQFENYQQARDAFTRSSSEGILTATLEDVSWLRFEGAADTVEKNHRAYFEYGYTTFQVMLRPKEYARPTDETFVLEDGRGARITGSPISFKGGMQPVDDRWQFTFELSFQHALGTDCQWVRLTRASDGQSVEWKFQPCATR